MGIRYSQTRNDKIMSKKNLLLSAIGLSLASGSLVSVAIAQENTAENVFEEVIVTATKRESSIYDVPVAISAFTADSIEKQGITSLTDIGKFVPNMNVTGFSAGHTSSANPFIRGIGLQDHLITTDPGVGVYVDGVYLGRQVGQNWSLANIERVEVLRGPQGTLYGRNSIGGAINIITTQPGAKEGGRVSATVGTRGRLNGDFYTNFNISEDVAMSVTGAYMKRDVLGKFPNADTSREVGEMRDVSGRMALKWQANDDFSLLIAVDGNKGRGGLRPYTTLIDEVPGGGLYGLGFRNSDVAANPYNNNTGENSQTGVSNEANGIALTAEYAFNDNLSAKILFSDRHSEYKAGLDDDSLYENILTFPEVGEADQTSLELQFNADYGDWDFVGGLYYFTEEGFNRQDNTVFLTFPGDDELWQDMESRAIYANVGYQINDRLRLSGGLRFTDDQKDASFDINKGFLHATDSRDWSETSWELAATYEMNDRMSVYGTVQNGYQSGQFPPRPFCLFGFIDFSQPGNVANPNCFQANENVTAINYEVGLKGEPMDNLRMSVALFHTNYSDLPYQVSTTQGAGFDTRNIIVDQTSTGIEWESTLLMSDNFLVHATIGYIDVDVDDPVAVAPLTPKWTASISPEYTMSLGNGSELRLRGDWSFRDDMYGEPTADPGRMTKIDSRSLINLNVTYVPSYANWDLSLYGTNITDERYDNARLNTGDYLLVIMSNDASEFGLRFTSYFGN